MYALDSMQDRANRQSDRERSSRFRRHRRSSPSRSAIPEGRADQLPRHQQFWRTSTQESFTVNGTDRKRSITAMLVYEVNLEVKEEAKFGFAGWLPAI